MTAFANGACVSVSWSPPGTTERIETTGIVIGRAVHAVAFRRVSPPQAYDVLTKEGAILAGVAADALRRIVTMEAI